MGERNLLSVAYKNVIGARRASWRTLNAESQDEKNADIIKKYKEKVEEELTAISLDVLTLIREQLVDDDVINAINNAKDDGDTSEKKNDAEGEAQVFYFKWLVIITGIWQKLFPLRNIAKIQLIITNKPLGYLKMFLNLLTLFV